MINEMIKTRRYGAHRRSFFSPEETDGTSALAFDRASVRTIDQNGFMHVAVSHITKNAVNPYYGDEIPGWKKLGLEPKKIYYGLRDAEELKKSLPTWNNLPLHIEHHTDSASNPAKLTRVGTTGSNATWNDPYIDNSLAVWEAEIIEMIEKEEFDELSCAYYYDPDFTSGEFNGEHFDFVMRNIRGNHVALVEEGRVGPDVVVADSALKKQPRTNLMGNIFDKLMGRTKKTLAKDSAPEGQKEPVSAADSDDLKTKVAAEFPNLSDEDLTKLVELLKQKVEAEGAADNETTATDEGAEDEGENDSEDLKKAMDECGLDSSDADATEAFLQGVKYAESLAEDNDEDTQANDENADGVEGAKDEGTEGEKDKAMDRQIKRRKSSLRKTIAMDHNAIAAQVQKQMRSLYDAAREVRPLIGDIDPMAFDSASGIYAHALKEKGINPSAHKNDALKSMVSVMLNQPAHNPSMARDSKPLKMDGSFTGLTRIKTEDY